MDRGKNEYICSSIRNFEHQIAGHKESIKTLNKRILKPLIKLGKFKKEVAFYDEIFSKDSRYCTPPAQFIPEYYGVLTLPTTEKFVVLEDLTKNTVAPCIIDLKIGRKTYEPDATKEKILEETSKYIFQEFLGFRISGYKKFNCLSNTYCSYDKFRGRSLRPCDIKNELISFFSEGELGLIRLDIIYIVILKLRKILRWMKSQVKFHFYSSSILIIYEGKQNFIESGGESNLFSSHARKTDVIVKMIDFAHVVDGGGTFDDNYIYGIENLILHLNRIIELSNS